jgi:hypothetical protein
MFETLSMYLDNIPFERDSFISDTTTKPRWVELLGTMEVQVVMVVFPCLG